jgi:hypothetical protein
MKSAIPSVFLFSSTYNASGNSKTPPNFGQKNLSLINRLTTNNGGGTSNMAGNFINHDFNI